MNTKEFKVRLNPAVLYFEIFYIAYSIFLLVAGQTKAALICIGVGILIIGYFMLWRPYKYTISRRTLIINRRLGKDKEVNIMTCETICDPEPRMTKIITNPRALELYNENRKRIVLNPKDRIEFIEAIVAANKRINVKCSDYAATHRSYEKKRKRALKEEQKKLNNDA